MGRTHSRSPGPPTLPLGPTTHRCHSRLLAIGVARKEAALEGRSWIRSQGLAVSLTLRLSARPQVTLRQPVVGLLVGLEVPVDLGVQVALMVGLRPGEALVVGLRLGVGLEVPAS